MSNPEEHISRLGTKATDKVTGKNGVLTALNFDLYGCIQYGLSYQKSDGETVVSWFDVCRLEFEGEDSRKLPVPAYFNKSAAVQAERIASGNKGACNDKPAPSF